MLTLMTYVAANGSGIVKASDGKLMSMAFPDFKLRETALHGNTRRFYESVLEEGQGVLRDPTRGDIVHSRANMSFKDEAEVASFLTMKYKDHLIEGARYATRPLYALQLLNLLTRPAA